MTCGYSIVKTFYICGMKKWIRTASSIYLAVLYCLAIVFYNNSSAAVDPSFAKDLQKDAGRCVLFASPDLFATEAQVVNLIKNFEKLPFSTQKNFSDRFVACVRTAELYIVNTFSRYICYSINVVERFEQADIIFPFQYFW